MSIIIIVAILLPGTFFTFPHSYIMGTIKTCQEIWDFTNFFWNCVKWKKNIEFSCNKLANFPQNTPKTKINKCYPPRSLRNVKLPFSYSNSSKTTIIKKLCKSKHLSNDRVVMLKKPLQLTCDLQRVFQHNHSVIWQNFQLFSSNVSSFGLKKPDTHLLFKT